MPDSATLRLVTDAEHPELHLNLDSRQTTIGGGKTITIRRADFSISLVRMQDQSFFTAIRQKQMWGR